MQTTIARTIIALFAAAGIGLASPTLAADVPAAPAPVSFGIVDMNKVMQTTEAAKDILAQLESKRKEYQNDITKEEDALRTSEQDLIKKKDTLSKEEFEKQRKSFEEKVMSGQKLVQEKKVSLDQAFNVSMTRLRNEAAKIVAEVAKEKGYSAVLTQDAVMISVPTLDITDIVIERMNKTVKKIPVEWAPAAKKK